MATREDLPGDTGTPEWWPADGLPPRAAALKLLGGLEKNCGRGIAVVTAVSFEGERIDLRLSSGDDLGFPGLHQLESYVAARIAASGTAAAPAPDPEQRELQEQWWEMLLDLSAYPSYFEDLHPRLDVIAVRRRRADALITVGDGRTCATYSVALDEGRQYPVGIPDDIRCTFDNATGPRTPFAKKLP